MGNALYILSYFYTNHIKRLWFIYSNCSMNPKEYPKIWENVKEIVEKEHHWHDFLRKVRQFQNSKNPKKDAKEISDNFVKNVCIY